MYGAVARYGLKPGMEHQLFEFVAEIGAASLPRLTAEYTFL